MLAEAREHPGGSYPAGRGTDPRFDQLTTELENRASPLAAGAQAKALQDWIRTGSRRYIEAKALIEDAAGMVLVPKDLAVDVLAVARASGMLRDLVTVRPTERAKQPVGALGAATVAWGVLETGATVPDAAIVPSAPVGGDILVQDLTTLIKLGQDELDDTPAATMDALTQVLGDAIAEAEDAAIAAGTGSSQPRGITLATNLAAVPAGQKTAASASNTPTLADLQGLPWKLPDRYRPRASWLIHPTAASKIAAITTAGGDLIWPNPGNPDPKTGGGFMGWPAYVVPGLPDPATAGTTDASVIFGDLRSAYRLVDRQSMTLQRLSQRFADTGDIGILVRYRVGVDLVRPGALAVYSM